MDQLHSRRSLGSGSLAQLVSQWTSRPPPTFFYCNESQYIFGRVAFNPKMWYIFIMRGVFVFSRRAMVRLPWLKDVRSEKAFLKWFITSWVYERGCLSSEWCALLLLHLKCFTTNMYVKAAINQTWQPAWFVIALPAVSISAPIKGTNTSAL